MGASQLGVYNKALRWLGERKTLSLAEGREPIRLLNDEWEDAVGVCLYAGFWNFAIRERMANPDAGRAPLFGFQFSYAKPPDWVRTFQISESDRYDEFLKRYVDQNNIWYADIAPIYVRHISNDPNYGFNLALWTPAFVEYVAAYLALMLALRVKGSMDKVEMLEKKVDSLKKNALSKDAMDQPPGKIPYGTWVTSRAPRGSVTPMGGGWDQD
jgi:hypothetical protein